MNKIVSKFLVVMCLFTFTGILNAQETLSEKNYLVYSVREQKLCTLQDIVNDMANRDVLFFGEEHNDSVGHFLEAKLFEMMYAAYPGNCALSMEMFDRDVQTVMNEYLGGSISEKHFKKDARVWSNYSNYEPMVKFAKENKINVVCANAAGRYSSMVVSKGIAALEALPENSKKNFAPLPYDTASGAYHAKLEEIFNAMHNCEPGSAGDLVTPGAPSFNIILGQSLWDATMAWSIHEYLKKHKGQKVLQVNGKFHSDEKFAIVTQLLKYNKKLKPLVISTAPGENYPSVDMKLLEKNGDYIIVTDPAVPRTFED